MHDKSKINFRYIYMGVGSIFAVLLWVLGDADVGFIQNLPYLSGLVATATYFFTIIIFVWLFDMSIIAMFDYVDYGKLTQSIWSSNDPIAQASMFNALGRFAQAIGLVFIAAALFFK